MSQINGSAVYHELQALRKTWRAQNLRFTYEQQQRYDVLVELRRARVSQLREEGRVWVGPSKAGENDLSNAESAEFA